MNLEWLPSWFQTIQIEAGDDDLNGGRLRRSKWWGGLAERPGAHPLPRRYLSSHLQSLVLEMRAEAR